MKQIQRVNKTYQKEAVFALSSNSCSYQKKNGWKESNIAPSPPLIAKHELENNLNIKGGIKGGLRILLFSGISTELLI